MPNSRPGQNAKSLSNAQLCQTSSPKNRPSDATKTQYSDPFLDRGIVYADKGDRDRAIADYNEALRLNPKQAFAFYNRGLEYADKGDLDHAIADYNEAIRLNPEYADALHGRGMAYMAKGDLDHGIADFTETIRFDPKNYDATFSRGMANLYAGAVPQAMADFDKASALHPKGAYAALWLDIVGGRSQERPSHEREQRRIFIRLMRDRYTKLLPSASKGSSKESFRSRMRTGTSGGSSAVLRVTQTGRRSLNFGGLAYLAAGENATGGVCNSARSSAGPVWRLKLSALLIRPT